MNRRTFLKLLPTSLVTILWPDQVSEVQSAAPHTAMPYGAGTYNSGTYNGFLAKFRSYLPTISKGDD